MTQAEYDLLTMSDEEKQGLLSQLRKKRMPILLSGVVAYLILNIIRSSSQIMMPMLIEKYALTTAQAGLFGAIYNYLYAAVNLPIGAVIDIVKARKIMIISYFLMTAALVAFAFSPNFSMLIVSRGLMGLGAAGFFPAYTKTVASWVSAKNFPKVSGYVMAASTVGGLVSTTPLTMLILGIGHTGSMLVLAGISVVLLGIMMFLMRNDPSEVGLPTEDEILGTAVEKKAKFKSTLSGVLTVIKQPRVWAIVCSVLVSNIAGAGAQYASTYMQRGLGFEQVSSANVLMVGRLIAISGPLLQGFISTKFGIKVSQVVYITLVLITVGLLAAFLPQMTPMTMILVNIPTNIGGGMAIATCQSLFRKNVTTRFYGTTVGLYNALGWAVGSGVFVQLFASYIDESYSILSFQKAYIFLFICVAVVAVIALIGSKDKVIPVFAGEDEK